jgi:hypothetical protein
MPFKISENKIILCLGDIDFKNEKFQSKQHIWPVGYKSKVRWQSLSDNNYILVLRGYSFPEVCPEIFHF